MKIENLPEILIGAVRYLEMFAEISIAKAVRFSKKTLMNKLSFIGNSLDLHTENFIQDCNGFITQEKNIFINELNAFGKIETLQTKIEKNCANNFVFFHKMHNIISNKFFKMDVNIKTNK